MGWFDDQIKQRKLSDDAVFEASFIKLGDMVMGKHYRGGMNDERVETKSAVDEILKYYHGKIIDLPDNITDRNEALEYLCRPNGIMRRTVHLTDGWHKDASGAFLARRKDGGAPVALLPDLMGTGYTYPNPESGKREKVTSKTEKLFETEAICFYKPLPLRKLTAKDLFIYGFLSWSGGNAPYIIILTLIVTLFGLVSPKINNFLFSEVFDQKDISLLVSTMLFMLMMTLTGTVLGIYKALIHNRADEKMNIEVQAAIMMRVLSLPPDFFKDYSSGEIHSRIGYMNSLCSVFVDAIFNTGITSLFSLLMISQVFIYAPALVVPSLIFTLLTLAVSLITTIAQMNITKKQMENSARESGMSYAMVSGIQKIRLAGAEKRAFARWAEAYYHGASYVYDPPLFLKLKPVFTLAVTLLGNMAMYYFSVQSGVSVSNYYAFNTAWGQVSGAFLALAGIATTVASIRPSLEMAKPLMDAVPEISDKKQVITRLSGAIEMNNISFRYDENMPFVLDDFSLKIRPGQYLAVVGKTGCGKSTLVRILLGFEKPQKGAVYYDGKDIESVDLRSLRRHIGSVMQNGKLFQGDVYSNIVISAPWLTLQDAWEAAEQADIADDIREMPMGMNTLITEGSGGISGGQRQRLMIARAVAPKPQILIFDEATSALDNITQKKVSESLDKLKCTRIVIAHRLSTIRHCDRIIMLEDGHIIEDGTYEELIAKDGAFADLVRRQQVNEPEKKAAE